MLKRQIAICWDVNDVLEIRPDLSDTQARVVLDKAERMHDAEIGINRGFIRMIADDLFPEVQSGKK